MPRGHRYYFYINLSGGDNQKEKKKEEKKALAIIFPTPARSSSRHTHRRERKKGRRKKGGRLGRDSVSIHSGGISLRGGGKKEKRGGESVTPNMFCYPLPSRGTRHRKKRKGGGRRSAETTAVRSQGLSSAISKASMEAHERGGGRRKGEKKGEKKGKGEDTAWMGERPSFFLSVRRGGRKEKKKKKRKKTRGLSGSPLTPLPWAGIRREGRESDQRAREWPTCPHRAPRRKEKEGKRIGSRCYVNNPFASSCETGGNS